MFHGIIIVFCLLIAVIASAQDVFELARQGDVTAIKEFNKLHPNNLNSTNDQGYTPLMLAAYHGQEEMAIFLVENGGDLNGKSDYGTPVMAAAIKGNTGIVKLLLDNGADPNISDARGNTALLYTSIFSINEIAELLLKAGANSKMKDDRGNMALDYAILKQKET